MVMDDEAAEPGAEMESAHTTGRMSARSRRIEVITRGERRRRWSVEQKREIAAESLEAYRRSRWRAAMASAVGYSTRGGDICWKDRSGPRPGRGQSSRVLK